MPRHFSEDCLIIASHNAGKVREIDILLQPFGVTTLSAGELGLPEPEETGDTFTAAQAAAWGFINRAVPADQLDDGVGAIVDSLKQCSPNALAETKKMARLVPTLPTDEGFRQMGELSARMFASPEAREGMTAFAEKRDPSWAIES